MSKLISAELRSENTVINRDDKGIRITLEGGNIPPIVCKFSDLFVFEYIPSDRIKIENLTSRLCERLEELHLPTGTFVRNNGLDGCSLYTGIYVTKCGNDMDSSGSRTEAHYLPYLWKTIRRAFAESGKRIFIVNYGVFEINGANEKSKSLIIKRLIELAKELKILILVFFSWLPDKMVRETSTWSSYKSIEEVFDSADWIVSLSFADNPAPEESGFL